MIGVLTSFSAVAIGGRELAAELSTFQILFFRSGLGLLIVAALISGSGWGQISLAHWKLHAVRNIASVTGQYGWFYALGVIPLAQAFAIEFTMPIWAAVLATLILRERMTRARLAAIALGLIGVLIILRPGAMAIEPGSLAMLGAAACFGFSAVYTRKLAQRESALAILFYMGLMQLMLVAWPVVSNWATPSAAMWPWLLVISIVGTFGHFCMARAMRLIDATVVAPMDFLRLPLIAVAGFVFYGEAFDAFVIGGGAMMLAGNIINIRAERAKGRPA